MQWDCQRGGGLAHLIREERDAGPPGPLLTTIKTPDGLYDLMIGLLGWQAIDCGLQSPTS
jgi:hypothetical protein